MGGLSVIMFFLVLLGLCFAAALVRMVCLWIVIGGLTRLAQLRVALDSDQSTNH